MKNVRIAAALMGLGLLLGGALSAASPASDAALGQFLSASSQQAAAQAAEGVVKAGATFDEAYAALKKGRGYKADVPRGIVRLSHRVGDLDFQYQLDVPQTYDPAKTYQLRVQLHGGVGRPDPTPRGNGIGPLAGVEQIYLLPTAWGEAEWWTDPQLNNLRALLDSVKRTYNIDENRVVLSGVSDGGTATYYFSMRDTTPFAAFLPLNGAIPVLRNTLMRIDGELFMNNMVNKPFFIVNGGKDPLYPTTLVEPYIQQMQKGGVELTYLPQPEAVHNTAWWPEVKDTYEQFVKEHPRKPFPDTTHLGERPARQHRPRALARHRQSRSNPEGSRATAGRERACRRPGTRLRRACERRQDYQRHRRAAMPTVSGCCRETWLPRSTTASCRRRWTQPTCSRSSIPARPSRSR